MKRIAIALFMLIPLIGFSQPKNLLTVQRVTPKGDKIVEFEKALGAHAQKYHTGDWKWRVSEVQTGPDVGAYSIVEGPASWTDADNRGDLGAEHMSDWNKLFGTLTTGQMQSMVLSYKPEMSSGALTDYAEKSSVTHVFPRLGFGGKLEANFKKAKKVWEASGQTILVYQAISSGEPQYVIVARYKTGWKEREDAFLKPFPERYNAAHGADTYDEYLETIQRFTSKSWGEMVRFRADLSSK